MYVNECGGIVWPRARCGQGLLVEPGDRQVHG
jgi:hypothetical protein